MTKALYLDDSYLQECDAVVVSVKEDKYVVLDQTIFYPKGGGQLHDTGKMIRNEEVFPVIYTGKFSGDISHEISVPGLQPGDKVKCQIEWDRRYKFMRSHTAAHTLAAILCEATGTLITGNQISLEKTRFDFNLKEFSREVFLTYIKKANELFKQDIAVKWYELDYDEAIKIPTVSRMAGAFPPDLPKLRIVEIEGIDKQADGGTHVRNLKEVGQIEFIKAENKGKNNRRVHFRLID
jgi:misacylated tRNA(Ala) deacylase